MVGSPLCVGSAHVTEWPCLWPPPTSPYQLVLPTRGLHLSLQPDGVSCLWPLLRAGIRHGCAEGNSPEWLKLLQNEECTACSCGELNPDEAQCLCRTATQRTHGHPVVLPLRGHCQVPPAPRPPAPLLRHQPTPQPSLWKKASFPKKGLFQMTHRLLQLLYKTAPC